MIKKISVIKIEKLIKLSQKKILLKKNNVGYLYTDIIKKNTWWKICCICKIWWCIIATSSFNAQARLFRPVLASWAALKSRSFATLRAYIVNPQNPGNESLAVAFVKFLHSHCIQFEVVVEVIFYTLLSIYL